MRWVIFGLVIVHGLIHFMGFCKAYGLGDFAQLTQSISKSICPGPPKGSRKVKYKASRFMLVTDIERQKFEFRKSVAIRTEEEFKARFGRKSGMDWSKQWMYWLAYSKLAIKSARIAGVVEHEGKTIVIMRTTYSRCEGGGARVTTEHGKFILRLPTGIPDKVEIESCFVPPECPPDRGKSLKR